MSFSDRLRANKGLTPIDRGGETSESTDSSKRDVSKWNEEREKRGLVPLHSGDKPVPKGESTPTTKGSGKPKMVWHINPYTHKGMYVREDYLDEVIERERAEEQHRIEVAEAKKAEIAENRRIKKEEAEERRQRRKKDRDERWERTKEKRTMRLAERKADQEYNRERRVEREALKDKIATRKYESDKHKIEIARSKAELKRYKEEDPRKSSVREEEEEPEYESYSDADYKYIDADYRYVDEQPTRTYRTIKRAEPEYYEYEEPVTTRRPKYLPSGSKTSNQPVAYTGGSSRSKPRTTSKPKQAKCPPCRCECEVSSKQTAKKKTTPAKKTATKTVKKTASKTSTKKTATKKTTKKSGGKRKSGGGGMNWFENGGAGLLD